MVKGSGLKAIRSGHRAMAAMPLKRETMLGFRVEGAPPLLPNLELGVVDAPLGPQRHGGTAHCHGRPMR